MINKKQYNRGEIDFGTIIVLFIVGLFIIWLATGGQKEEEKPFIKPNLELEVN